MTSNLASYCYCWVILTSHLFLEWHCLYTASARLMLPSFDFSNRNSYFFDWSLAVGEETERERVL